MIGRVKAHCRETALPTSLVHTSSRGRVVVGCRDARHHHAHRGRSRVLHADVHQRPAQAPRPAQCVPGTSLRPPSPKRPEKHEPDRTPCLGFAPRREPGAPRGVIRVRARALRLERGGARPGAETRRRDPTGERAERSSCALAKKAASATTDPPSPPSLGRSLATRVLDRRRGGFRKLERGVGGEAPQGGGRDERGAPGDQREVHGVHR